MRMRGDIERLAVAITAKGGREGYALTVPQLILTSHHLKALF